MFTNTRQATPPVEAGDTAGITPEFGRIRDVERLYGLKRGSVYNLLDARKIKGCVLRIKGKKSGVRLIELASVGAYIRSQMRQDEPKEGAQ
jgi:hypothetical protein